MLLWPFYQLDVKNAFMKGDLQEEIYLKQPPGFVAQRESFGLICHLRKSLYGLNDEALIPTKGEGPWHMLRRKGVP